MDEIIIESRDAFIAAVRSQAQTSYSDAKQHPFTIRLADTKCHWKFPEGLTVQRAEVLARCARMVPKKLFTS